MSEFDTTCCGIPCIIRVTYWEAYVPAKVSGPPENCYPAEGGCGDWEILDRRGRPAPWLEKKLQGDARESERLEQEVFDYMENRQDDYYD
jgi:hypothetical protein